MFARSLWCLLSLLGFICDHGVPFFLHCNMPLSVTPFCHHAVIFLVSYPVLVPSLSALFPLQTFCASLPLPWHDLNLLSQSERTDLLEQPDKIRLVEAKLCYLMCHSLQAVNSPLRQQRSQANVLICAHFNQNHGMRCSRCILAFRNQYSANNEKINLFIKRSHSRQLMAILSLLN